MVCIPIYSKFCRNIANNLSNYQKKKGLIRFINSFISFSLSKLFKGDEKMADGYCVKCKTKREMKDSKEVTMKNGRKAVKGKCSKCGTGMYKILGK